MRVRPGVFAAATIAATFAGPLRAHHPLDAYDERRTVTLIGIVANVEWVNPHTRLLLEVKAAAGETTTWSVELDPPNAMTRARVGPEVLKQGDEISVDVWLAKDGSASANGRALRTPDGTVHVMSATRWASVR
jgi:hypothetical protein